MTADALAHAIVLALGLACVALFFRSIIIAVFLDRPRHDAIARAAAWLTRVAFDCFLSRRASQARIDRGLLWYWPVAQFVTIYTWYTLVAVGFGAVNWGSYASPDPVQALLASGSALSTVGFATPANVRGQIIAVVEGGIGLFLVVFLLTFLPGYLTARQVRGDHVAGIYARAGTPPTGDGLVAWHYRGGGGGADFDLLFGVWERWMRDLGVSHSQSPGLAITRSYRPAQYWVSAVMAMMDAAAIARDVLEVRSAHAVIFLDAAQHALERVATAVRPRPSAAPPVSRAAFDAACDALAAAGAPVQRDREAAWRAFCETQDGYAALLASLAGRIRIGPDAWQLTARPRA
jgi:hypothetical protein